MSRPVARTVMKVDFGRPARPGPTVAPTGRIPRVARLLALAHWIHERHLSGEFETLADVSRQTGLSRARITQIMNLLLLAPKIQEAILAGARGVVEFATPVERWFREIAKSALWQRQIDRWIRTSLPDQGRHESTGRYSESAVRSHDPTPQNGDSVDDPKYLRESEMIEDILRALAEPCEPWGEVMVGREFGYLRGRADLVAVDRDGKVIAFEAKLHRWRDALHQAYRNTCFAHASYVVLPPRFAAIAARSHHEFISRSVGLCAIRGDQIDVLFPAEERIPLQPWLAKVAREHARADGQR